MTVFFVHVTDRLVCKETLVARTMPAGPIDCVLHACGDTIDGVGQLAMIGELRSFQ
jgi:hypothetical protein